MTVELDVEEEEAVVAEMELDAPLSTTRTSNGMR